MMLDRVEVSNFISELAQNTMSVVAFEHLPVLQASTVYKFWSSVSLFYDV